MIIIRKSAVILRNIKQASFISFRSLTGINLWNEEISSDIKQKLEKHWQPHLKTQNYKENDKHREKYYVLSMFPYPSGHLHMGHVRVYTISDTIARFQRMNGKNVIHPIGWDAFGLPAENAAIERQVAPDKWTKDNITQMKHQLKQLGCSFEWDRELATCDPKYYKWTQDLFLKLYDSGMVYQKEALVNWDPVDQTVLADEQVDANNCSWRSGAKVEKKLLRQWFVRTTRFAKSLLDGLDDPILYDWRDIIKLQKHWIGECNGVNFDFALRGHPSETITLWTSKPEFIKHVKFVVVNKNNILAKKENVNGSETVKLDVELVNPFTDEVIPVYLSEEIEFMQDVDSYIGLPSILEESTNFALNHQIPFTPIDQNLDESEVKKIQDQICNFAIANKIGGYWTSAKLRDWLISRQRYWGTPIPIVHCKNCGTVPISTEQLPVELPQIDALSRKGASQLADLPDWINTSCPKCGGEAKRETDTMDTFVDSSWYYLRYLDPNNDKEIFDVDKAKRMTPVDLYIGGKEHAVLHLYYARFINHFLHSVGLLPEKEPFKRLLVQGMVMGRSFRVKGSGRYLQEKDVTITDLKKKKAVAIETGEPVVIAWEKMSKSKHNGVDPNDMFDQYGIDTTRLLVLADVAPTSHRNWNNNTFPGILNWQKRLWLTVRDFIKLRTELPEKIADDQFQTHDDYMYDSRNYYVKGVTFNYAFTQQLSIAVSKQQGLTNSLRKVPPAIFAYSPQFERALAAQIIMLAPMAPHFASELWSGFVSAPNRLDQNADNIQWEQNILEQKWPEADLDYKIDLEVQINGTEIMCHKISRRNLEKLSESEAVEIALKEKEVQSALGNRDVIETKFLVYKGCEGVINLITPKVVRVQPVKEAAVS